MSRKKLYVGTRLDSVSDALLDAIALQQGKSRYQLFNEALLVYIDQNISSPNVRKDSELIA